MNNDTVTTHRDGEVYIVRIERPDAMNAVDPPTAKRLYEAFVAFDRCGQSRVAVLTGSGGAFCSGFDLKALAGGKAADWLDELHFGDDGRPPLGPMGPTRMMLSKPVIAAIAGPAVAGGMELAAWCDVRVMEKNAYMGVFCRRFGVPLIDGGTVRLPALVGRGRALDLILTGRRIDAPECLAMGLCERVVPTGHSVQAAIEWAHELAAFPQACLRADRRSVLGDPGHTQAALEREFETGRSVVEKEAVAGARAFAEGAGRHGTKPAASQNNPA